MLTEDEAKTKWCPFVRQSAILGSEHGDYGLSYNRSANSPALAAPCIGSACMAWRWIPLLADDAFAAAVASVAKEIGDKPPAFTKAVKIVRENREKYGLPVKPFDGFCGLAGRPA